MKASIVALFASAAYAAPSPQIPGLPGLAGLAGAMMPQLKMASRTVLKPELRAEAKRTLTRYGPYKVIGQDVVS